MDYALQKKFLDSVNEILETVDFKKLEKSCNSYANTYAVQTLQKMHQAFLDTYQTDCLCDRELMFVELPAVIRNTKTGHIAIGLVTLDLSSSGEHWNTMFFSPVGVLDQCLPDLRKDLRKYMMERYIPYDYWYTPEVPCDIHTSFDRLPHKVEVLLSACSGMCPSQQKQNFQYGGVMNL